MISGNMVGSYSQIGKTFILVDEAGNEISTGVVTDSVQVFDATDNDVRLGKAYVSDLGVSTGTKDIPAYRTSQTSSLVLPGEQFSIVLDHYDQYNYTQLLGIIAKFNTSFYDSVASDRVILSNCVYAANSTDVISNIEANPETRSIDFNMVNNTDDIYIIHCVTYKEEA